MSDTPTIARAIRAAIEASQAGLRVSMPGRVVSYDAARQRASVQPLIPDGYVNEDGERRVETLPVVTDVPIVFPGAGPYSITFPIAQGDSVLLVFADGSLERWLYKGDGGDPGDDRRHTLTDAIAIPGLRHLAHPEGGGHTNAITITAPEVRIGSKDADDPVARKSDLDAIKTAINNAATGSQDGGALFKQNILSGWPTSVGSPKVKVE